MRESNIPGQEVESKVLAPILNNDINALEKLLNNTPFEQFSREVQTKSIFLAAYKGYTEILGLLRSKGINLNVCLPTKIVYSIENYKLNGLTPASMWHLVADEGTTTLHMAALGGQIDTIRFLEGNHLDLYTTDVIGNTPLYFAAISGHLETVKYLYSNYINRGIAPNNLGQTLLHQAAMLPGNNTVIKFFMDKGLNINQQDNLGSTILHYASKWPNVDTIVYLIVNGANIYIKNSLGLAAIDVAKENHRIEVVEFLEQVQKRQLPQTTGWPATIVPQTPVATSTILRSITAGNIPTNFTEMVRQTQNEIGGLKSTLETQKKKYKALKYTTRELEEKYNKEQQKTHALEKEVKTLRQQHLTTTTTTSLSQPEEIDDLTSLLQIATIRQTPEEQLPSIGNKGSLSEREEETSEKERKNTSRQPNKTFEEKEAERREASKDNGRQK